MSFRPAEFLMVPPGVFVSDRACSLLNRVLRLDRARSELRGQDVELDQTLLAIKRGALRFAESSANVTRLATQPEPGASSTAQLHDTVSTKTAGEKLGITDSAIRKAIRTGRLNATKVDGRYRITTTALAEYRQAA